MNGESSVAFWSLSAYELFKLLGVRPEGLTRIEARQRLEHYGANLLKPKKRTDTLTLLLGQFKSPIILMLIFVAGLSFFLRDAVDALIVLSIVLISGLLGFWQERGATNALEKLLAIVQTKAMVLRDGTEQEIPVDQIVPGDVVTFSAGAAISGDCLLLEFKDLFVDEAVLTGETYPVEKTIGELPLETPLAKRTNVLFMGTHVISGTAKAVVVHTGTKTEFGKISERLTLKSPETEFEKGVKRFGYFLIEVTLLLVIVIFAINVYMARPVLQALLFSLALAVGLTPQLLPAIISINLAHGAKEMARKKVIVKRLSSIENFGSMNVLCADKTGTLTEGLVQLESALDVEGNQSEKTLLYAYLNAVYETGFKNPLDQALRKQFQLDISAYQKLDEVPYDFFRKRLSILFSKDDTNFIVTKGALLNVLSVCSSAERPDGKMVAISAVQGQVQRSFEELSNKGLRVLGVACRDVGATSQITKDYETNMTFLGFLVFFDPPKSAIAETINRLKNLGVLLKIITGDNKLVAASISREVGLFNPQILTGSELRQMSDEAILKKVNDVNVFAEIEPNQKQRLVLALRKVGNVVGFIGDGINDASALHSADVGISVDTAVDVAKEAADIVLLEKDLGVLVNGVQEGRKTFANTLKYVFIATSANFGNMFSMAGVSLFLSFLPLLPKQILLTNLMTDFPEMVIATDSVDKELTEEPHRWDIKFIRRFMITFGVLSSVFDYLTFGVLWFVLHSTTNQFRTAWFLESVVSAAVIVLIIRTRKPLIKSKPGSYLLMATLLIVAVTLIIPFTRIAALLGFQVLPISFIVVLAGIVMLYVVAAEIAKIVFYKRVKF
jgi:Mg2+-importing ATPase